MTTRKKEKKIKKEETKKHSHHWDFRHWIYFGLSIVLAVLIFRSNFLKEFISSLGVYEYFGALIAGFFFAFTFTVAPSTAAIILLGSSNNPILIGIIGALGATAANFVIFTYFREEMPKEMISLAKKIGFDKLRHLKNTKINWVIPLIAGIIMAFPVPDELGDYIFEESGYPISRFLIYSYIFSAIGLAVLASLG